MRRTERSLLRRYGVAIIAIIFATLVGILLNPAIGEALPITLYFAAIGSALLATRARVAHCGTKYVFDRYSDN